MLSFDTASAGGGSYNTLKINSSNLSGMITLLTDLKADVEDFKTKLGTAKTNLSTQTSGYVGSYYSKHMGYIPRSTKADQESYKERYASVKSRAESWIKGQTDEMQNVITTLEGSENLSDAIEKFSTALEVFTNIQTAKEEFDSKDFDLDYDSYFKSAVITFEDRGWLEKTYSGSDGGTGGEIVDGKLEYRGEDGKTYTGEEGRRAAYTMAGVAGGTAVVVATAGHEQGWSQQQIDAAQAAGLAQAKQMVQDGFDNDRFRLGDNREDALQFYKQVTGEDYDPDKIDAQTRDRLRAAGINPDILGSVLGAGANPALTGAAATVLPVVAASLPDVITRAQAGMTDEQIADWGQRLAISPVTGKADEDILRDMGLMPPAGKTDTGAGLGNRVGAQNETTTGTIREVIGSTPASTIGIDSRLSQAISDTISPTLPGGTDIHKYSTLDQVKMIEQQALEKYFGRSSEEVEAERLKLLQETEDAYNGVNVDEFKQTLKKGGYSDSDINYIMEHKEVGFTAYVMATQAGALTDLSNTLAAQNGIIGFDSSFDNGLNSISLYNGQAQASLGAELDPDVTEARTAVNRAKASYHQKVDSANESIERANNSKKELEDVKAKIVKRSGEDTSKWTEEDIEEYNRYVEKYNKANKEASDAVSEANNAKDEYDSQEANYRKVYDEKYQEYLKEAQEGIKAAQQVRGDTTPIQETSHGTEIPGESYDGSDSSILATITGEGSGLSIGDGEQALGVSAVQPGGSQPSPGQPTVSGGESQSYDGSDSAILSGLNLGGGDVSIGSPDAGIRTEPLVDINAIDTTVGMEPPTSPSVENTIINSSDEGILKALDLGNQGMATHDDRVLPNLGLNVDVNAITGGVDGVTAIQAPDASDAAILNSINITDSGMSNTGNASSSSYTPIDTPALNSMVSPDFDRAMSSGSLTTSDVDNVIREDTNSHKQKTDTSKFVEPPGATEEVHGVQKTEAARTEVENGIVIELSEDGSLRL